jgi:heme exporter protein C
MRPSTSPLPHLFLAAGAVLLGIGSYIGLFRAPAEHYMGDVMRIMYVHVPTAWSCMLAFTYAFGCASVFLLRRRLRADAHLEAALEIGVVFCALLCFQGAVWAKPTWGVYWDWDPRLTTTAVMLVAFAGILALRSFVPDPLRRATWSSVATILAFADVPIVYFSVRWWNSLHQLQSSPETVSPLFVLPLRLNALGVLLVMTGAITLRARVAMLRLGRETAPPPLEAVRPLVRVAV